MSEYENIVGENNIQCLPFDVIQHIMTFVQFTVYGYKRSNKQFHHSSAYFELHLDKIASQVKKRMESIDNTKELNQNIVHHSSRKTSQKRNKKKFVWNYQNRIQYLVPEIRECYLKNLFGYSVSEYMVSKKKNIFLLFPYIQISNIQDRDIISRSIKFKHLRRLEITKKNTNHQDFAYHSSIQSHHLSFDSLPISAIKDNPSLENIFLDFSMYESYNGVNILEAEDDIIRDIQKSVPDPKWRTVSIRGYLMGNLICKLFGLRIERLELFRVFQVKQDSLTKEIFKHFPQLKSLVVDFPEYSHCHYLYISDFDLSYLKSLEEISLNCHGNVDFLMSCQNLRSISLGRKLAEYSYDLFCNLPKLEHLSGVFNRPFTLEKNHCLKSLDVNVEFDKIIGIRNVLQTIPHSLEKLIIKSNFNRDLLDIIMNQHSQLRYLEISHSDLEEDYVTLILLHLKNLTTLKLKYLKNFEAISFKNDTIHQTNLHELDLSYNNILSSAVFENLLKSKTLYSLSLAGYKGVSDPLKLLKENHTLTSLNLSDCESLASSKILQFVPHSNTCLSRLLLSNSLDDYETLEKIEQQCFWIYDTGKFEDSKYNKRVQ